MQGWQNLYVTHKINVVYITYQQKPKEKEEMTSIKQNLKWLMQQTTLKKPTIFASLGC